MEKLAIGLIQKSFGVWGHISVLSFSGETDHFFRLKKVYIGKKDRFKTYRIESLKKRKNNLLIKLEGVDSPEAAKLLVNLEIWAERIYGSPLKKGEYYFADLCKCSVFLDGQEVGRINSICEGGVTGLLEIKHKNGKNYFIPFIKKFIKHVDIKARKVYLHEDFTY